MGHSEIVKLKLEARVTDMVKGDLSERDIADTLSKESGQKITQSSVHRYLTSNTRLCREVVAVNNKMKVMVLEVELDTIEALHQLITKIRKLGDKAEEIGDIKTALYALDKAVSALDSLDKRLGQITEPAVQVNIGMFNDLKAVIVGELCPECKIKIKGRLHEIVSQ
ncbi:MAG: hypothetical protein WA144_12510 [Candidatus Methanoperedens sp.]